MEGAITCVLLAVGLLVGLLVMMTPQELEWSALQKCVPALSGLPSMLASVLLHSHSSWAPRGESLSATVRLYSAVSLSPHVLGCA